MTAKRISVKNGLIEANALDFQKQVNTYHESMNNVSAISPVTIKLYEKLGGPQCRVGGPLRGRPLIEPDLWFSHIRLSDDSCPELGARRLREHVTTH